MADILEIKNLYAEVEGKRILNGINLVIKSGEVHALMGPNGSGKSTLANVLSGHPKYKITEGSILFNGEDLTLMSPTDRAKKGLFMSFQHPSEVEGVTISNFLRMAYSSVHEKIPLIRFKKLLEEKSSLIELPKDFASRYLNEGFSGGEKKKSEMLQMAVLDPKLAILDETDSGLDIDSLKAVSKGISTVIKGDKSALVITHYKRILEYVNPDKVSILIGGKIVKEGKRELVDKLEKEGYSWIVKGSGDRNI